MKKLLKITFTLIITAIIILGFALPLNPVGNWYQQFMPNNGGRTITDITFTDSLTGYAVTSISSDTSYILKTTNSGDNWFVLYDTSGFIMNSVHFFNQNTGYVGGTHLIRTTDGGSSWSLSSTSLFLEDFHFISVDTGWFVKSNSLTGGVFRTTNGGAIWQNQLNIGSQNPNHIYMYDKDTGFAAENVLYKTTNSGVNWIQIPSGTGFSDMYFVNGLTGWKCYGTMQKTTDGGLSWVFQIIPSGGILLTSGIKQFTNINSDTIWGVGGLAFYGAGQFRGVLYRTTNGGNNWLFQIPDTAIHSATYQHIQFTDKLKGWAYWGLGGVHTLFGGDTGFVIGLKQISSQVPIDYDLFQNYPNPFNPLTNIKYCVKRESSDVRLIVYDLQGKHIAELVNQKNQSAGTYEVDFGGIGYSSGVYFYSLIVEGKLIDTKKMIMLK